MTLTPQGDTSLSSQQACVPGFRGMFTIPKTGTLPYPLVNLLETRDSRMGWQVGGGAPGTPGVPCAPSFNTRALRVFDCASHSMHLARSESAPYTKPQVVFLPNITSFACQVHTNIQTCLPQHKHSAPATRFSDFCWPSMS